MNNIFKKSAVLRLISGSLTANTISFLFIPILSRVYSPSQFGEYSEYYSYISIIGIIASLRLDNAIIIAKDAEEEVSLILAAIFCLLFTMLIVFISSLFWLEWNVLYGLGVLVIGFVQIYNSVQIKNSAFSNISTYRIISSLAFNVFAVSLVFMLKPRWWLQATSFIGGFSIYVYGVIRHLKKKLCIAGVISVKDVLIIVKRYKSFAFMEMPAVFLNNLSWQIVPIFILYSFGKDLAGQYGMSLKLIQVPMGIISVSIGQVFIKRVADISDGVGLRNVFRKSVLRLFIVGLPISIILGVASGWLFPFFLGDEWKTAGLITQILSPWVLVWFVASPLNQLTSVLKKQSQFLIISILNLSTRILSVFAGRFYNNYLLFVLVFTISGVFVYTLNLLLLNRLVEKNEKRMEEKL